MIYCRHRLSLAEWRQFHGEDGLGERMAELTLYPAIDVLGGRCVRLRDGDASLAPVFDDDPVAVAKRWREAGAEWLHVIDLDGALAGEPKHLDVVRSIADATGLPLQVGGGLRTEDAVAAVFAAGAKQVILGAEAAREPELLAGCLARWRDHIAVSVDSRGGNVTAAGWFEVLSESAMDIAKRMALVGVQTLLVTNVERGVLLADGDTAGLAALREALPETRLIAAGSFSSLDDVRWLAAAGMDGAVLGRALYDGTLDLVEALHVAEGEAAPREVGEEEAMDALLDAPMADQARER